MLSSIGANPKIPFVISKVYVWSILLEPFLYFLLFHQSVTIVGFSVARILQLIVVFYLFSKINNKYLLKVISPFSLFNYKFSLYFLYMIIVSIFGLTLYEYDWDALFSAEDTIKRQLFEFIVQLYYFIYFAVFPRFFIRSKKGVEYFFKVFFITFFITVFFGIADLFSVYYYDSNLIARQIYEDTGVGFRFHGFNGEPRNAYVYLVLSVSLFAMYSIWKQTKLSKILMVFIAFLILLTQSMSFIVGVLILTGLLPLYYAKHNTIKSNIIFLFLYFIAAFFMVVALSYSYRIGLYFDALQQLYSNLNQGLYEDGVLSGQMVNIIPIWDIWLKLSDYNPIPLLFGHGVGSSSVVNNAYLQKFYLDPEYSVLNPHAQIIRSVFEGGIVGTLLFISLFLSPFKKNLIRNEDYKKFIFVMLLVLSAFLSHRNVAPYILFGIASVIFPLMRNEFNNTVNHSKIFDQK